MADAGDEPRPGEGEQPDSRARLMHEVAEQMDAIESDYPEGFRIGRVITIVEVMGPGDNVDVRVRAGQFPWVSLGMLDWAKKSIEAATGPSGE